MNKYKKDDTVIITKGKDKGKKGKVKEVFPNERMLLVENINMMKKHVKPTQQSKGGIMDIAGKIQWCNTMVVCKKTDKPTKVGYKEMKGKKVRVAKVSGEVL